MLNYLDTESKESIESSLINKENIPDFSLENVQQSLEDTFCNLEVLFAKRIEGIFNGLSSYHVTNNAFKFSDKLIIASSSLEHLISHNSHYGSIIHDLRNVISLLQGNCCLPERTSTRTLLTKSADNTGKWIVWDGGCITVKVFKKGTVHLKIDESIADHMNAIVANIYPEQLASVLKAQKQKKELKSNVVPINSMLSNGARDILANNVSIDYAKIENPNWAPHKNATRVPRLIKDKTRYSISTATTYVNKAYAAELESVLFELCTDTDINSYSKHFIFDFDPTLMVEHLIVDGRIPEMVTHQFYESTDRIYECIEQLLVTSEYKTFGEPNAGNGKLANLLPPEQTTCIDVSKLRCRILESKGFNHVIHDDFLNYVKTHKEEVDCVVMNPPWSKGRANIHTLAAIEWLAPGGKIIAVLPSTMESKLQDIQTQYSVSTNVAFRLKEKFKHSSELNVIIIEIDKPKSTLI